MQEEIIEAFNETNGTDYRRFKEIRRDFPVVDILDTWLRYEGIVGYTRNIIDLLGECEVYIEE